MIAEVLLSAVLTNALSNYDFLPWESTPTLDHLTERLCPAAYYPDETEEKWFIECSFEGANYAIPSPYQESTFTLMAFNMERGYELDKQIQGFLSGDIPTPDVLLLSEADRGCTRSGYRNTAKELAEALKMNYVFGVEFVELERKAGGSGGAIDRPCEHGQAILSRFPLGNVQLYRHQAHGDDRYVPAPERFDSKVEARLGTRADLIADVKVGDHYVRVASIHYDNGLNEKSSQTRQAEETVKFLASSPLPVIIGGDTNAHFFHLDLKNSTFDATTKAFFKGGYSDAHARLGYTAKTRKTITHKVLGIFNAPAVVDAIVSDRDWAIDAGICNNQTCQGTSDHFPIFATFDFAKLGK